MDPRRRTPYAVAGLLLVTSLAAGCGGGDEEPGAAPSSAPSSATSEATTGAPTEPSEPTEPTTEPTQEAPAPTGPRLALGPVSMTLTDDFVKQPARGDLAATARGRTGVRGNLVILVQFPVVGEAGSPDDLARISVRETRPRGEVLPNVEVGGVTMGHVYGDYGGITSDKFIAEVGDVQMTITFGYDPRFEKDRAYQEDLMAQVLPTVEWS